jgi:Rap1a immunity proteins
MTKFAVAILLFALTVPAGAQDISSANFILTGCKGYLNREGNAWAQGHCVGFIDGLVSVAGGQVFSVPDGVTNRQGVAVVVKYIEARPERMHEPFSVLAVEAMMAAWPCKR